MIDFGGGGAPTIDFEDDGDVTSVVVFRDKGGCLVETNDDLDDVDLDEGEASKVGVIGGTEGALVEDDDSDKRGDILLV
ncbi:hypothetical protein KI387_022714, partial [Taxus chinensis]